MGGSPEIVADVGHLPFRGRIFDITFFSDVLFCLDNVHGTLPEASRVLRLAGHIPVFDYTKRIVDGFMARYRTLPGYTGARNASWILHQSG